MRRTPLLLALAMAAAGCGGGSTSAGPEEIAVSDVVSTPTATATANPKDEAGLDLADASTQAEATPSGDSSPAATPTATPTPTGPPTEDLPGGRYVEITDIGVNGQSYAVAFEPFNFVPLIGSGSQDFHVHFFWNTVEPQNAGTNGPSPAEWFLYDGPSPFTGYSFSDRPPAATQVCSLVADAAHGVTVGSGNCVTLP